MRWPNPTPTRPAPSRSCSWLRSYSARSRAHTCDGASVENLRTTGSAAHETSNGVQPRRYDSPDRQRRYREPDPDSEGIRRLSRSDWIERVVGPSRETPESPPDLFVAPAAGGAPTAITESREKNDNTACAATQDHMIYVNGHTIYARGSDGKVTPLARTHGYVTALEVSGAQCTGAKNFQITRRRFGRCPYHRRPNVDPKRRHHSRGSRSLSISLPSTAAHVVFPVPGGPLKSATSQRCLGHVEAYDVRRRGLG